MKKENSKKSQDNLALVFRGLMLFGSIVFALMFFILLASLIALGKNAEGEDTIVVFASLGGMLTCMLGYWFVNTFSRIAENLKSINANLDTIAKQIAQDEKAE